MRTLLLLSLSCLCIQSDGQAAVREFREFGPSYVPVYRTLERVDFSHDVIKFKSTSSSSVKVFNALGSLGRVKVDYECDDESFDNIFPPCSFAQSTVNSLVGRLTNEIGVGTGTIFEKIGNRMRGIAARHNFITRDNNVKYGEFFLANARLSETESSVSFCAKITIDAVYYLDSKDVCIFEGTYETHNEFYVSELFKHRLSFLRRDDQLSAINQNFTLWHYPGGTADQRQNTGKILKANEHDAATFPGSSGAPIFINNNTLFGVHIGVRPDNTGGIVCYNSARLKAKMYSQMTSANVYRAASTKKI